VGRETDASGRVHFTAPFRWAEAAEHSLLRTLGHEFYGGFPQRRDHRPPFHLPLVFEDHFEVFLGVRSLGRTSITYTWQVVSGGEVCVTGSHAVILHRRRRQPEPLPRQLRADLAAMLRLGLAAAAGSGPRQAPPGQRGERGGQE
jgi:acyl-CoA thioesterase FadM